MREIALLAGLVLTNLAIWVAGIAASVWVVVFFLRLFGVNV